MGGKPASPPIQSRMPHVVPIALCGHRGKMGQTLSQVLASGDELSIVAEVGFGEDLGAALKSGAQALVDFTVPQAALGNALAAAAAGVAPVVGTTGLSADEVERLEAACATTGGAVIPNFAIGAVVMMRIGEIAAPYFDAVEVVETHDARKKDAPSGTAVVTAERLSRARGEHPFAYGRPEHVAIAGTRGGEHRSVGVHSLRLPGVLAEQEIIFGTLGQTLSIRHRTSNREAYVPGVVAAVRAVVEQRKFFRSLDEVLGL